MNTIGWFKAYRSIIDKLLCNGDACRLYCWLNCHGSDTVEMTYREVSDQLEISRMSIYRSCKMLVEIGAIEMTTIKRKTVIKIINHCDDKKKQEKKVWDKSGTKTGQKLGQDLGQEKHEESSNIFDNYEDLKNDSGTTSGTTSGTILGQEWDKNGVFYIENKNKNKNDKSFCQKSPKAPKPPSKSGRVVSAYAEAYLVKYQVSPLINAKTNSIACKIVDALGEDHAIEVVRHYLTVSDRFIDSNKHSIGVCLSRIDALSTEVKQKKLPMGGMTFGTFK